MHSFRKSAIIAFSSLFLLTNVNAASCSYEEKAKLNNEIANVKSNYEIKERVLNKDEYTVPDAIAGTEYEDSYIATTEYIQVNILNLTENMYAEVTSDYDNERKVYQYSDTTNGNISFDWHQIGDLVTYTIKVYASSATSCSGTALKTMTQKLPRYNEYSDYNVCDGFSDYYLCQRFVTYEPVDFESFSNRMTTEIEKKLKNDEEVNGDKWYKKVFKFISDNKVWFITGGIILVVGVGSTTFIIIKKRRREII